MRLSRNYSGFFITCLLMMLVVGCGTATTPTTGSSAARQPTPTLEPGTMLVYRSPTCGCCSHWISYVEAEGFRVEVQEVLDVNPIKMRYRIPPTLYSCHTALIENYVLEGHVPVAEINRLLAERPDVLGLAVAGMPMGSPGMEVSDGTTQPYDVLTFDRTGKTTVFAHYP